MNEAHIGFGFVKTKSLEELKSEFLTIPPERIHLVENEYNYEHGNALLREAKIDNFIGNFLKTILLLLLAALTVFALMNLKWFFTPLTFGQIFLGFLFVIFIVLPTLLMSFICYLIAVLIVSGTIKHVFFYKQTKFLEKLRKIKADIDSEKRYQERRLEIEKQQLIKNKSDSILRDLETIGNHFKHKDHTHLLSNTRLENPVSEIYNEIIETAIYEANRKDKTDSYKSKVIEEYKKLLYLLAFIEQDEFVEKVNQFQKLMSLVDPNDANSDFNKSLLTKISELTTNDPKLLRYSADAISRYEKFLNNLENSLKTRSA